MKSFLLCVTVLALQACTVHTHEVRYVDAGRVRPAEAHVVVYHAPTYPQTVWGGPYAHHRTWRASPHRHEAARRYYRPARPRAVAPVPHGRRRK